MWEGEGGTGVRKIGFWFSCLCDGWAGGLGDVCSFEWLYFVG